LSLVRFPAIAREISTPERAGLDGCEEPGIELLRELLDNLREHPVQISAQVIERWAGKPGGDSLQKLLQREELIVDSAAAARELKAALATLADRKAERRLQQLEAKSRTAHLEPNELQEFQELTMHLGARNARGG